MPPKRKSTSPVKAKVPTPKSAKISTIGSAKTALKKQPSMQKKTHKPDPHCGLFNVSVVEDYDCMLNQTNIGANNNKFFVIQILKSNSQNIWHTFTRWGRVGEPGATLNLGPFDSQDMAVRDFEKKFQDKTRNKWGDRANFKPSPGKYTLLEMGEDNDDNEDEDKIKAEPTTKADKFAPSKLPAETQKLIDLIFSQDMFKHVMENLKVDTKKMPLGKLSMPQIQKGFAALEELEKVIQKKKKGNLTELTSTFYTIIPHSFGRMRPPVLSTAQEVREKLDMLLVLADIVEAQQIEKKSDAAKPTGKKAAAAKLPANPLDKKYDKLDCDLTVVSQKSNDYKLIDEYIKNTKCRSVELVHLWQVNRRSAATRFKQHDKMTNRKLLWHGTNVAVVAAILKSGLRIMPQSGGRVGKGIYFASENGKSAAYVGCNRDRYGVMFLNEVALGKSKLIYQDDSSLVAPPGGFDSVLAKGVTEPNPSNDEQIKIDGKQVTVPKGRPKRESLSSSFSQSEYLVYKESQCRIRYLLLMKF